MNSKFVTVTIEYEMTEVKGSEQAMVKGQLCVPKQDSYLAAMHKLLDAAAATDGGGDYRLVSVASVPCTTVIGSIGYITQMYLTGFYERP